jgi:Ca2+-binding EF-hand superfamily protein
MSSSTSANKESVLKDLAAKLPYQATEDAKKLRAKLWKTFDVNGNNLLSLAEVDKGVKEMQLPALFSLKPVLMRAFTAACKKSPSKSATDDNYISPAEFRFLLTYLQEYYELWLMFDEVDADNDRRVDKKEFFKAQATLKKFGMDVSDMEKQWKAFDANGGGFVLFDEFAEKAISLGLDHDPYDGL